MNTFKVTPVFVIFFLLYCSLIEPDHSFELSRVHSYKPGTPKLDSLSVLSILKVNGIPVDSFSSVAEIGSDWRVHSLKLGKMGIDTLPPEIGNLSELEHLDISNNNLRFLPDSIIRINLLNISENCFGATGYSWCWEETSSGLMLDHNQLCNLNPAISQWIDMHFRSSGYIESDSTQNCQ